MKSQPPHVTKQDFGCSFLHSDDTAKPEVMKNIEVEGNGGRIYRHNSREIFNIHIQNLEESQ
jgi:hypothetical protein